MSLIIRNRNMAREGIKCHANWILPNKRITRTHNKHENCSKFTHMYWFQIKIIYQWILWNMYHSALKRFIHWAGAVELVVLYMDCSISSGLITCSQILKTPFFTRYFEFLPWRNCNRPKNTPKKFSWKNFNIPRC